MKKCWHWLIFPVRRHTSIFSSAQLNFCVRNGYRWTLCDKNTNFFHILDCSLSGYVGIDLFSRTVASQVSSAPHSLTSVFGMGTGGPCAIVTPTRSRLRCHTSRSFLRNIHITTTVLFNCPCNPFGAPPETRTPDPLIKSQLLYQLS